MANFTTSCLAKLPIGYKPVFFAHKSGKGRAARPSFWENNSTKMNNSYQSPTPSISSSRSRNAPAHSKRLLATINLCRYKIPKIALKFRPNSRKDAVRQMRTSLSYPATSISKAAQRPRHSARAATRFRLKFDRLLRWRPR